MEQLKTPNLNITYTGGMCLKAIEDAFGTAHLYPTASASWAANEGNHPNENPPTGVYVPIYFSLWKVPAGHIAISLPDGRVASSTQEGVHQGLYIHPNMKDLIMMYAKANGGCAYLGWSERLAGTPIVQGGTEMTGQQIAAAIYAVLGGDNPNPPAQVLQDKGSFIDANGEAGLTQVMSDVRNAANWIRPAEHPELDPQAAAKLQEIKQIIEGR
jgi:hypothetical protein